MIIFVGNFFILQATILYKELGFFALRSVHQDTSFELSKTDFLTFFSIFHPKGDPYDLGRPKNLRHP